MAMPVPNPEIERTRRFVASTWRASVRPASWLVSLGSGCGAPNQLVTDMEGSWVRKPSEI